MSPKKKIGREMSFLQHLEELRWAILKSVLAILVGMVACFSFHEYIVEFLISPTLLEGLKIEIEMQAIRPAGMFTTIVNICLVGGFALALPYVLYNLWSFVSPGLLDNEKKYVPIVIFFSCVLFLMGAAFAFYILIPVMVRFFIQLYVPGISAQWDIGFWIGLVNKMVLIMGIVFQMPIVVAFLTWIRILSADKLKRVWRVALVVIFIVAAIITPTGDPYTQTLVAIPLVILYFISMGIAMLIGRSRKKREAEEDDEGDEGDDGDEGQPALTTEEPDTPTLPRDSSPSTNQGTGRAYWPDDDEYIYDYDAEMGYSVEPIDKADESDRTEETDPDRAKDAEEDKDESKDDRSPDSPEDSGDSTNNQPASEGEDQRKSDESEDSTDDQPESEGEESNERGSAGENRESSPAPDDPDIDRDDKNPSH